MARVICDLSTCPHRTEGRFCDKEFVMLNKLSICTEYFDDNGNPRVKSLSNVEKEAEEFIKNN